jgi:hypothetical protein
VGEGDDEADGAVATHAEVADVIEEDDAGGAGGVDGCAEQGADEDVGAAGLVDDGGAEPIVRFAKRSQTFGHGAGAEVGRLAMTRRAGSPPAWESMTSIVGMGARSG